jgi:hypothetical protein
MRLTVVDVRPEGAADAIVFEHGYAGCAEPREYQVKYFAPATSWSCPTRKATDRATPGSKYSMVKPVHDPQAIEAPPGGQDHDLLPL